MTPFEAHMRKFHPDSTTARLSREVEKLRAELNPKPALPWELMHPPSGKLLNVTPFGYEEPK